MKDRKLLSAEHVNEPQLLHTLFYGYSHPLSHQEVSKQARKLQLNRTHWWAGVFTVAMQMEFVSQQI